MTPSVEAAAAAPRAEDTSPAVDRSKRATPPEEDRLYADRFGARWSKPALCRDSDVEKVEGRNDLLRSFEDRSVRDFTMRADPTVGRAWSYALLEVVGSPSDAFESIFGERPWTKMEPPALYVYRDTEQLRRFSCVNAGADAYYDGAIHISAVLRDDNGYGAIQHELVHHALRSRGILMPTWLQEGLAMYAAGETWVWRPELGLVAWAQTEHLPFDAMIGAFPDGADEKFARVAYFQSLVMLYAIADGPDLLHLIAPAGLTQIRALIDALATGEVSPEAAFSWATQATQEGEPERAWKAAVGRL